MTSRDGKPEGPNAHWARSRSRFLVARGLSMSHPSISSNIFALGVSDSSFDSMSHMIFGSMSSSVFGSIFDSVFDLIYDPVFDSVSESMSLLKEE